MSQSILKPQSSSKRRRPTKVLGDWFEAIASTQNASVVVGRLLSQQRNKAKGNPLALVNVKFELLRNSSLSNDYLGAS